MPWDRAGQGLGVGQGKGRALGQGKGRAIGQGPSRGRSPSPHCTPQRATPPRRCLAHMGRCTCTSCCTHTGLARHPYGVAAAAGALARGLASFASSPLCAGDSIPGPIASELRRSSERTSCSSPMMEPSGSSRRI